MGGSIKHVIMRFCPSCMKDIVLKIYRKLKAVKAISEMVLFRKKMVRICPCCGLRFKSFNAGNYSEYPSVYNTSRYDASRKNVHCPVCRSMPRHRIFALWCEKHKNYLRKSDILYFAPEYSMILWMNRNKVSCVTADLYQKADLQLDIQDTGLLNDSYDVIVCNHVLEHVDDFRIALKELYRILRNNGLLICSFPMDTNIELIDEDNSVVSQEERLKRFGQNDHKRVFGMKADQFLKETGFVVKKISGDQCPDSILPIVGPADYDMNCLFVCKKFEKNYKYDNRKI